MLDLLHPNLPCIIDLKTIGSAAPDSIQRSVEDHHYALRRAAYVSALGKLRPDEVGRIDFAWLFLAEMPEGSPDPVALVSARPDGSLRELGERQWNRAVLTWKDCLNKNYWPCHESHITIEARPWTLQKEGM